MASATLLGLAFWDFLVSNVKKEKRKKPQTKQTSVLWEKENTVWGLVMIYEFVPNSRTCDSTEVSEIRSQEYLQLVMPYTPLIHFSVQTLGYMCLYMRLWDTLTHHTTMVYKQDRRRFVGLFCFVLFSNSVHWQEDPVRTWRNIPWLKGEKGYNNELWF